MSLNRDFFVALFFLILSGVMFVATFQLPPPMFGQMSPALWPRIILVPLALLAFVLLISSQRGEAEEQPRRSLGEWFGYYRNPIVCFALFFLFLVTMPVLGMLIGGLAYVFLTLSVLGGWKPRQLLLHAVITAVFVVGMWAIFTLLLGVFLPEGALLRVF
ncbi:tripartite tricarboxylate transporter TctB family protein [Nitratireductor sp. XY-223]|uniref:tripartite tricarboxylate transporter TctB family protein n=1 Tax=Nitratireductor sp. XY-223 TaxID=2561926 RepID=UPI0010AAAEB5|nr:tripartite tricarboxylate transporter TctB family protein [Nitratireductor sp. XY-223]